MYLKALGAQKFAIRDTSNVLGQNQNSSTSVSVHKYPFKKTPRNEETTFTSFAPPKFLLAASALWTKINTYLNHRHPARNIVYINRLFHRQRWQRAKTVGFYIKKGTRVYFTNMDLTNKWYVSLDHFYLKVVKLRKLQREDSDEKRQLSPKEKRVLELGGI